MPNRRLAPLLAAVAALGYAVEGAIVVRAPQPDHGWHASGYVVEAAFIAALLASLPLVGLLQASAGRASASAAWLTRCGFAAMLVSAIVSLTAGGDELGPVFLLGVLAALAGLATLAVDGARHRDGVWWTAAAIAAGFVLSIALGDHGGGILFGIAWATVGLALRGDCAEVAPATA